MANLTLKEKKKLFDMLNNPGKVKENQAEFDTLVNKLGKSNDAKMFLDIKSHLETFHHNNKGVTAEASWPPAIVMSVIKTKEKELELNADSAPTPKPKGF